MITATATANTQNLTATGTVTVAAAAIGSIAFISATPSSITLKGVGSATGSSTSTVIFKVLDVSGGPRAGATVNFSLTSTVGGISITPASAVSDANGQVQTIVSGGTVATTVSVKASTVANGTTISTESNALTLSTGIPSSANISLSVKQHNVEAWNVDGVVVPVTVRMTDRFSNPVPDGTTANFQTNLGGIDASCQTVSGTCTVNWVSKEPRHVGGNPATSANLPPPAQQNPWVNPLYCTGTGVTLGLCGTTTVDGSNKINGYTGQTVGRSVILVTTTGEESFHDATGNGYFNPGDTVAWDAANADNNFTSGPNAGMPKPWQDTSEPFLNEWEIYDTYGTPVFFSGEPYLDFNNNAKWDGPDGFVQSALCQGPLCSTSGSTVAIGATNVIVMSGSDPVFVPAAGATFSFNKLTSLNVPISISDVNLQQMPAGTTVSASLSSQTGTIQGPSSFTWPDTSAPGGEVWVFSLVAPTSAPVVAGSLIVTVKTPGGVTTTAFYTITP